MSSSDKAAFKPAIATIFLLDDSYLYGLFPGISRFNESLPVPPTNIGFKSICETSINPDAPKGPYNVLCPATLIWNIGCKRQFSQIFIIVINIIR